MSDPLKLPDNFHDAEVFQRLFVKPMVDAVCDKVENQLKPVVDGMKAQADKDVEQDNRLAKLEGSQSKALLGWGVFATGLSIALSAGWNYVASWFKGAPILVLAAVMLVGCGNPPVQVVVVEGEDGNGSGFVLRDGIVMTASHCLDTPVNRTVHVEGNKLPATRPVLVPSLDTGFIEADVKGKVVTRSPRMGETVKIVGFVRDSIGGYVKIEAEGKVISGAKMSMGVLSFTIQGAAGPGMSGGPVIGEDGAVVGLVLGWDGSPTLIRAGYVE